MIGAKLLFVLTDLEAMRSGAAWFDNGKTILAGLVGGYLGVELAKELLGVTIKTGDSFAVPVAATVAVGWLACFVGGCCYGKPTSLPWGVVFHDGVARHPTQLYESAFHALPAVFLAWTERRGLFRNQRIKLYLIAYLVYRFCTEFLRPEPILALGLTVYQFAALVLLPLFAWLWYRDAAGLRAGGLEHGHGPLRLTLVGRDRYDRLVTAHGHEEDQAGRASSFDAIGPDLEKNP